MLHGPINQRKTTAIDGQSPSTTVKVRQIGPDSRRIRSNATSSSGSLPGGRVALQRNMLNPQTIYGNQAILRVLSHHPTTSAGVLQRKCACEESGTDCTSCAEQKEGALHRSAASHAEPNSIPPIVNQVLRSQGQPLDANTRAFMGPRFGIDLSEVRIHTDARAAESARAVNALAYTVGSNIVFGEARYSPSTSQGRRLIAHELAHYLQQAGMSRAIKAEGISSPHDAAEQDADRMANAVIADKVVSRVGMVSQSLLARAEADETAAGADSNQAAPAQAGGGCRKTSDTTCPGSGGSLTRIEYFPQMLLKNLGTCALFVGGTDAAGVPINRTREHFSLQPGESGNFVPEEGSVGVVFGCDKDCTGTGVLEHPYLCA